MAKKLHVGNLAYSVSDESLKNAFAQCGTVESATIVKDRQTGKSKGFGFIEMSTEQEASDAIQKLNKFELNGRIIFVSESRSTGSNGNFKKNHRNGSGLNRFGKKIGNRAK